MMRIALNLVVLSKASKQMGLFAGPLFGGPGTPSRVKAHTRVTHSGKAVQVKAHTREHLGTYPSWEHARDAAQGHGGTGWRIEKQPHADGRVDFAVHRHDADIDQDQEAVRRASRARMDEAEAMPHATTIAHIWGEEKVKGDRHMLSKNAGSKPYAFVQQSAAGGPRKWLRFEPTGRNTAGKEGWEVTHHETLQAATTAKRHFNREDVVTAVLHAPKPPPKPRAPRARKAEPEPEPEPEGPRPGDTVHYVDAMGRAKSGPFLAVMSSE